MPEFSQASLNILNQAHEDLIKLFKEVIKEYDCTIVCAYRGQIDQENAFINKKSNAHFGQSAHNFSPSLAIDCVPWPTMWSDENKLVELAGIVQIKAIDLGIEIIWGGIFPGNYGFKRNGDLPHYELKLWKEMIKDCV